MLLQENNVHVRCVTVCLCSCSVSEQRWRWHFKSGQATANKRSLVHVHGGGGEGLQQAMCGSKNYLWNQNAAIWKDKGWWGVSAIGLRVGLD